MLPEPTIPEPSAAPLAVARPHPASPSFQVTPSPPGAAARRRRPVPGRGGAVKAAARMDAADLLGLTPERFRRALWRSFLRYGVGGDLDTAVHAAMTVIEPVLEARDAEITRLREVVTRVKRPGPAGPPRPRAAAARVAASS